MNPELIKKFYIESRYQRNVDFGIVHGTMTEKNFNVKQREPIIGLTFDTRIPLDSDFLFDNFKEAAEKYFEEVERIEKRLTESIKYLQKGKNFVKGLLKRIEQ